MAYRQKPPTFMRSCLKQKQYWYKVDGKNVSKEEYNEYQNIPGQMEGGGKTTNDPDASGRKAATEKARSKNKRPTVLTEAQTKLLKERTSKKSPPFKATAGFNILMEGAGKDATNKYTSGDRSYRGSYDIDFKKSAFHPSKEDISDDNGGNGDNGGNNTFSSTSVKWPPKIKGNKKQRNYATTSCEIVSDKHGKQTNKFTNLTKKQQRKIRKGQVGGI
jgi:hypothetical protein